LFSEDGGVNCYATGPIIRSSRAEPSRAGSGFRADANAIIDAEQGSLMLANMCNRSIDKFATQYGIEPNEARILLLETGVRL
jgi:hypothetical protein